MSQEIQLGAIVVREGRLLLFQPRGSTQWELPGGVLTAEHEDVDSGMETLLAARGIETEGLSGSFIETVYIKGEDGHVVYNLYSAENWSGDPSPPQEASALWVTPAEISGISMDEKIRNSLLVAFGLRAPVDEVAEIMGSMQSAIGAEAKANPGSELRTVSGLDVLRTLSDSDADARAANLRDRYGELGDDVIDFALGEVWADPTLDRRTRSLMVVSMLAALGRTEQLRSHMAGALNHGATAAELVQATRMVAVYAGFPAALTAHSVLREVCEARGVALPGGDG